MSQTAESRRHDRHRCTLPIRVARERSPFVELTATDISEGGIGIAVGAPLPAGTVVDLWIHDPAQPFYARGCIAHDRGIEFVIGSLRERRELSEQVKRIASARG